MSKDRVISPAPQEEDRQLDLSLRPKKLSEFVGQSKVKEILKVKKSHKYKTRRSVIVDNLALTTLRYLSSITILLEKAAREAVS